MLGQLLDIIGVSLTTKDDPTRSAFHRKVPNAAVGSVANQIEEFVDLRTTSHCEHSDAPLRSNDRNERISSAETRA